jgi:beta-barrel assembly-enhancing protease
VNWNGTYTNSNTGVSVNCRLVLFTDKLYIYLDDNKNTLLIWNLHHSDFQWSGSTLTISKSGETLTCSGDIAHQVMILNSSQSIKSIPKKKFEIKTVHVFFLMLGMLIVAAALFVYFYLVPWIAEKSATLVPLDIEVKIGEKIAEGLTQGAIENDSVNYYAERFVKQLDLDTEYPVKLQVLESEEINAFALPGGKIFIYSGLLEKMDSAQQLVALIGHELTHVTKQHSLKSIFRGAAAGVVLGGLFGDAGGISSWVLSKADEFKQLEYSRDLETEADNNGIDLMIKNKVDPQGMLDLLYLLQREGQEMPGLMKYLSTHPDTEARIQSIKSNPGIKLHFGNNSALKEYFKSLKRCLDNGQ